MVIFMLKSLFRAAALVILCLLLVYAPELLVAVRAPYGVQQSPRVLLRIALCTQDGEAASAFYRAVSSYQKENRTLHLRISRVAPGRMTALPEPHPDLYAFSPGEPLAPEALLLPLRGEENVHAPELGVFSGMRYAMRFGAEHPLLIAVAADARESAAARALLDALCAQSGD